MAGEPAAVPRDRRERVYSSTLTTAFSLPVRSSPEHRHASNSLLDTDHASQPPPEHTELTSRTPPFHFTPDLDTELKMTGSPDTGHCEEIA